MNAIEAVVVGAGYLGKEHARIYSELAERVRLTAVVDIDKAAADRVAAQCGSRPYYRLQDVPGPIHLASVAVPTVHHHDVVRDLLNRGIHVLVEKPIAQTVGQAEDLVRMARGKGLILQVGHVERYNPAFKALETVLTHPRFIECHRLSPFPNRATDVGVVLDLMIHDIDVVLHLTRSNVREIRAVGVPVLSGFEDIANARLEFENGCIANLTTSRISMERMRKIRVFQPDAYISLDYFKQQGKIYRKQEGRIVWEEIPTVKEEPLRIEISSFVDCVRHVKDPLVTGEHGQDALEVAMAVLEKVQASTGSAAGAAAQR